MTTPHNWRNGRTTGQPGNLPRLACSLPSVVAGSVLSWALCRLASPAKNKACPCRVTLRIGQNGAEELAPPGPAILVRGTETLTVMTPYLPDDERAQRLNALHLGEIELSDAQREKRVLHAARGARHAAGRQKADCPESEGNRT
jgi:hypothetical protein